MSGDPLCCRTVYDEGGLTITVTTWCEVPRFSTIAPAVVVITHVGVEVGRAEDSRLRLAPRRRLPDELAWAGRPLLDLIAVARENAFNAAPCDAEELYVELAAALLWLRRHIKTAVGVRRTAGRLQK